MSMPSSSSSSSSDAQQQQQEQHAGPVPYSVNPKLSITRVGSRAYYKVSRAEREGGGTVWNARVSGVSGVLC